MKGKPKGDDKNRFGLCSFCDARGCQNADNPAAGIATCSVFGGCACKPNASLDEKHAQLEHIVAGSTQPYLLVVPQSELWRAVILEDELPAGFIPTVGTNIVSWIGCFHREKTRARMALRQQLAEALIRDNANILGQPDRLGRLIMLSGTPEFSHPDESNGTFTFASSVDPGPLRNDDPHGRFGTRPAVDSVVAKAFSLRNRASSTKRYPMPRQLPIGATQPPPRRL